MHHSVMERDYYHYDSSESDDELKVMEREYYSSDYDLYENDDTADTNFLDSIFSYSELQQATSNFSDANLLGRGGFGKVYRGSISGTDIAIKLLDGPFDEELPKLIRQEVNVLRMINHPHLVPLVGACQEEFSLIYEFMPGGTLEDRLSLEDLPWHERLCIAIEICSALEFLHSYKPKSVVHGSVKPSNILLDANGRSKLSDLGNSQLIDRVNMEILLHDSVQGSIGYLDPRYIETGKREHTIDIFAFGMVLIRLLTYHEHPSMDVVGRIESSLEGKCLVDELDNVAQWPYRVAEELSEVAIRCCDRRVKKRPVATRVLEKLKQIQKQHELSKQQTLLEFGDINWNNVTTFLYSDLQGATSNFSDARKIGEGGFGKVYKGNLWGTEVAIKTLITEGDTNQIKAFCQEVEVLFRLHHPNLVRLIGACPKEFVLVYEFIPGGNLEDCLGQNDFHWEERISIATQICSGLVFLHCRPHEIVVHGDLKPANILLDGNGKGMLSDFGICRSIPTRGTGAKSYINATVIGSLGYLDPAFIQSGMLKPSADVYAFGMLLLRLLTNQKPETYLLIYNVEDAISENRLNHLLDKEAGWPEEAVNELAKLALDCCSHPQDLRPDISEVLGRLNQIRQKKVAGDNAVNRKSLEANQCTLEKEVS